MHKLSYILILVLTCFLIDSSKYSAINLSNSSQNDQNFFIAFAIWCYRCNSATPGCSDNFNWRGIGYLGDPCPEDDDVCVKVIETKGGK